MLRTVAASLFAACFLSHAHAEPFPQGRLVLLGDEFSLPSAVAVDRPRGRIFVAEAGANAVRWAPLSAARDPASWSALPLPAGMSLSQPEGLAVAPNGDLYIADTGNGLARRFAYEAASGSFVHDPGFPDTAPDRADGLEIFRPRDVAVSPGGAILLLDSGNGRLLRAASAEAAQWEVLAAGADWRDPMGLGIAPDGTIWIADTGNHRLIRIAGDGAVSAFGGYGTRGESFRFPSDVAVDTGGRLHIADAHNNRIVRLHPDGSYDAAFGLAPLFGNAQGLAVSEGDLFVADIDRGAVMGFLRVAGPLPYNGYIRQTPEDAGAEPGGFSSLWATGILVTADLSLTAEEITARGIENLGTDFGVDGGLHHVFVELSNRGTDDLPPGAVKLFSAREPLVRADETAEYDAPFPLAFSSDTLTGTGQPSGRNAGVILTPQLPPPSAAEPGRVILGPWQWRPDYGLTDCRANGMIMARHLNGFDEIRTTQIQAQAQSAESNDVRLKSVGVFRPDCVSGRDRYEANERLTDPAFVREGWEHLPARCPRPVAGRGYPDMLCEGVFNDGITVRSAEEIFVLAIPDLTLDTRYDQDVFRIVLPDIEDPRYGLTDIRPGPGVEQMPECGVVQREDPGPGGAADRTTHVLITTTLAVEVVPSGPPENPIAHQPVEGEADSGDRLSVYDPADMSVRMESDRTGPHRFFIDCPRSVENLEAVIASFGERYALAGGRPLGARLDEDHGGYRLAASYIASIERGVPGWARDPGITGEIARTRCLGVRPFGGGGTRFEPAIGSVGLPQFPFCGRFDPGRFRVIIPPRAGASCIADGPGCFGINMFDWAARFGPLDLLLVAERPLLVELLGPDGRVLQERELTAGFEPAQYDDLSGATAGDIVEGAGPNSTLYGAALFEGQPPDGLYGLRISGAPVPVSLIARTPVIGERFDDPDAPLQ